MDLFGVQQIRHADPSDLPPALTIRREGHIQAVIRQLPLTCQGRPARELEVMCSDGLSRCLRRGDDKSGVESELQGHEWAVELRELPQAVVRAGEVELVQVSDKWQLLWARRCRVGGGVVRMVLFCVSGGRRR